MRKGILAVFLVLILAVQSFAAEPEGNSARTNNIARKILNFKTPNEMVRSYFMSAA